MVSEKIQARYANAVMQVLVFFADMNTTHLTWTNFDEAVCSWIETAYAEGEHKTLVSFALAGLQFFLPTCVGKLKQSWRLAKVWQRLEPPVRVLPISPLLVGAFAGAAIHMGFLSEGASLLIGFDCMLRSGELYNLCRKDITFLRDKAVLCLGKSKSGKRTGTNELVVVESHCAVFWLRQACSRLTPADKLLFRGERFFRKLFYELIEALDITVYSLRRGGATWNFLLHGSMEKTLLRGRWSSTSTARIYLQDATATVGHLQLSDWQVSMAKDMARFLQASGLWSAQRSSS